MLRKQILACALTLGLTAPANAAVREPVFEPQPPCDRTRTRAVERLDEILAAVRTGEGPRVSAALDQAWSTAAQQDRAGAEPALIRWAGLSRELHPVEVCATGTTGVIAYYQNSLTGVIDRLRVAVEDGGEARVTEAVLRPGFRTGPDPASTRHDRVRLARLDAFLDLVSARGQFSGVVLVARDGKPIYLRASGVTGQTQRPIRTNDVFEMASSTKMFTAVAIFQLIERGQLSLDTPMSEAAPGLLPEEHARLIQVRHLLSHTSGIVDGSDTPFDKPGRSFRYANSNFFVLGKIVEGGSGMRYEDYLRLHILGPLGMANTARFEMTRASDALVTGFMLKAESGRVTLVPNPLLQTIQGGAQGGYYSTAEDMLRFATALRSGRLISKESLDMMRSVHPELGATDYGYGIVRWRGRGIWGHAGDLPGADADIEFYGDTPYTAIVLSNIDAGNDPIIARIRSLFFPEGGSGPPV